MLQWSHLWEWGVVSASALSPLALHLSDRAARALGPGVGVFPGLVGKKGVTGPGGHRRHSATEAKRSEVIHGGLKGDA